MFIGKNYYIRINDNILNNIIFCIMIQINCFNLLKVAKHFTHLYCCLLK